MSDFSFTDRRGTNRSASNFYVGDPNTEMRRLRQAGYTLPNSPVQARVEAKRVADTATGGSLYDATNRAASAQMRRARVGGMRGSSGGFTRTGANVQMALPKVRQPLSSLADKGIPYNVQDPKELTELRRWCSTPRSPVWMADYTFKPIGEIEVGDQVIGWDTDEYERTCGRPRKDGQPSIGKRRVLTKSTVLAVNRRMAPEVVRITFASGRIAECTPDHEWLRYFPPGVDGRILNGPERSWTRRHDSDYAPLQVGSIARSVICPPQKLDSLEKERAASWLAGIIDGEGSWNKRTIRICQSEKVNPAIVERIDKALGLLGITHTRYLRERNDPRSGSGHHGGAMVVWDICQPDGHRNPTDVVRGKNRQQIVDIFNWARPAKFDTERMDRALLTKNFGEPDEVVSIESLGPGEVVSMQTTTGNYTAWGYASKNCRLFYSTHDLVPLLIDIYAKFPVVGLEFQSKDKKIQEFYESMFMDDLNYGEFLPEGLGREYFTVGEVTSLAHFNESLGIWSSEEILNPDMVRVSKSLFVNQERVQLLVKDMVENLRSGPQGSTDMDESPSERLERTWEYQQLVKQYPEIVKAAAQDDGLDISDALVSRLVNKASWWDLRGTPHLLRSFRTLMMEESLNAAQDAVADRLYAPMILATMGIENMGDGEPWIPDQGELDDLRDDMQNALAADFKLLVHNFGVNVQSVFGRESVPRFDQDYDRIDAKLLQAWGIGQALIAGGSGAGGTYASSALNREVCEQLMLTFQNKILRHIKKRMEVIAEAQEHYDYDLKGGQRVPIYREIVQYNEETGEEEIVRVPKLLLPDIKFATLNLRDEAQERQFIAQLKQMGVPVSDGTLAVNIPIEFDQELEKQAEETVSKGLAKAQAMDKLQKLCDAQGIPYPDDLVASLSATLTLRQGLAQTEMVEGQANMQEMQIKQMSPAGQMGLLPGTTPAPPPGAEGEDPQAAAAGGGGQQMTAATGPTGFPPVASGPGGVPEDQSGGSEMPPELPRNRNRPAESDEQRSSMPKGKMSKFEKGPSSFGRLKKADTGRVERAVKRREAWARGVTVEELVNDPESYVLTNMQSYEDQIRADWPEIQSGGAPDSRKLLEELVEQYEEVTGITPRWN